MKLQRTISVLRFSYSPNLKCEITHWRHFILLHNSCLSTIFHLQMGFKEIFQKVFKYRKESQMRNFEKPWQQNTYMIKIKGFFYISVSLHLLNPQEDSRVYGASSCSQRNMIQSPCYWEMYSSESRTDLTRWLSLLHRLVWITAPLAV